MFLNCPAYLYQEGTARCGLPAEVRYRFTMHSTDGPLESVMLRCPVGHYFNGPIESLTWESTSKRDPYTGKLAPRAERDSLNHGHDDHNCDGGFAIRDSRGEPEPEISRPNTAPAYYLGHPADLWITVMHQRRRPAYARPPTARRSNWASPSNPVPLATSPSLTGAFPKLNGRN